MRIDENNPKHIIADEGKEFIRISDNLRFGTEIFLGKTFYENGIKLEEPKDESVEDFKEIDLPQQLEGVDICG
jgi:hypothetical protein